MEKPEFVLPTLCINLFCGIFYIMKWNYKLYYLKCPDTHQVKYIGLTKRTLKERFNGHISQAKSVDKNWARLTWIRSLLLKNKKPIIEQFLTCYDLAEAKLQEIYFIDLYLNTYKIKLKNATKGGDAGLLVSKKNKIDNTTIRITQYSLEGDFIKTYGSIEIAARAINKEKGGSKITICSKGDRKSAYGYVWRRNNEPFDKYPVPRKKSSKYCKIYCYNLDGTLYKKYNTSYEIMEEFNLKSESNVFSVCVGRQKTYANKVFRYEGDSFYKYNHVRNKTKKRNIPIFLYSSDNKFIKKYNSISECVKEINYSNSTVSRNLNKKYKEYIFRTNKI